ncbi:MAG: GAF domain-containing protein [Chloroflexi bacterium]|nr:GAF domain-containing protein [Chloroflexota bacterium]
MQTIPREDVLSALDRLAVELAEHGGRGAALQYLVDMARNLSGADAAGVWEAAAHGPLLSLVANSGLRLTESLHAGDGLVRACATRLETVIAPESSKSSGDALAPSGFAIGMAVPLVFEGEFLGVVAGYYAAEDAFGPEARRALELLAPGAAVVLYARQASADVEELVTALGQERERLRQLQRAVRGMLEQPDTHANLLEITQALQSLGWGGVTLALYDDNQAISERLTAGLERAPDAPTEREIVPEAVWKRYVAGELEAHRVSGVYFVSSEGDSTAWQPDDLVFAPLRFGQSNLVGAIRVQDPVDGLRPSPEALRALDVLASQAAYVLENARLLEESTRSADALAEQVDELSMMHRADRELGAHLDMDRIMTLTMDWALRRTRADTGLLALMTDDRRGLVPFITMGYLDQAVSKFDQSNPWPLTLGAVGEAAHTGQTIVIRGLPLDEEQAHLMPGARAQIAVPLSMRGEILGVIMLASGEPETFEDNDVSFLERLARRAAVALDNARLFRQSEQLADDMAVLYSASRTITSTLDRDEVLQHIAQSMAVALECSSALILDYQAETKLAQVLTVYRVGTARNANEALPSPGNALQLDQLPLVLESIASQRPLILRAADPTTPQAELLWLQQRRIQSALMIPLVAQGELIGVALVIEGRRDRSFTSNEVFKAQTLASQASVALRQSLLFNEVLELEKVKSEMIRMASHDLRNPLNNILGYIELVNMTLDPAQQTPEIEEYMGSLRRSAKTMQSLIDDLLTLERVESERESEWQEFDLSGLVYEVTESEQSSAFLRNIHLALAREVDHAPVFGSMTQLRQAISNLIGNAVKYTPDGGQVEVQFAQEGQRLQFSVKDTGYGISPERQTRLFERFYRAREPGTDHIPGTGLGLSLVKTVIERHGGQVWYESEVGVGSTFGFWLPAAQPAGVQGAALM